MHKLDSDIKNRTEENEVNSDTLGQGSLLHQSKANHNHDKPYAQQAKV